MHCFRFTYASDKMLGLGNKIFRACIKTFFDFSLPRKQRVQREKVKSIKGCLFWYVVLTSPNNLTLQTQFDFCMFSFRHTPGGDKLCKSTVTKKGETFLQEGEAGHQGLDSSLALLPCPQASQHLWGPVSSQDKGRGLTDLKAFPSLESQFYLNVHTSNYRASLPNNFLCLMMMFILYLFFFLSTNECSRSLGTCLLVSVKLNAR